MIDPSIAYCINGCPRLAVGEKINGMYEDDEVVELMCYECIQEDK